LGFGLAKANFPKAALSQAPRPRFLDGLILLKQEGEQDTSLFVDRSIPSVSIMEEEAQFSEIEAAAEIALMHQLEIPQVYKRYWSSVKTFISKQMESKAGSAGKPWKYF
jgi:hypothetical protein